MVKSRQGKARL